MNRVYLPEEITGDLAVIRDMDHLHHLRDVLRLKPGEHIMVFDSTGREFLCSIDNITRQQATLSIIEKKPHRPAGVKLTVACALPKKSGFDDIVDKLTQIGVDTIIPLHTSRVITKPEENQSMRLDRWRKIARSAAEQSQRNTLPEIADVVSFANLIAASDIFDFKLIPTLEGDRHGINKVLNCRSITSVLILIGPEGDFTPGEIEQAVQAGFKPVSMGNNVLKVETAAIAAAAYIRMALM